MATPLGFIMPPTRLQTTLLVTDVATSSRKLGSVELKRCDFLSESKLNVGSLTTKWTIIPPLALNFRIAQCNRLVERGRSVTKVKVPGAGELLVADEDELTRIEANGNEASPLPPPSIEENERNSSARPTFVSQDGTKVLGENLESAGNGLNYSGEEDSSPVSPQLISTEVARRRNFAIISHPDAGKTTLTEKLLLFGGAIHEAGAVKARRASRHATSDWMELEKQRGISITSTALVFETRGLQINLLDTPGHQDFGEDTFRTLAAADNAVILVDGGKGLEPQTRKLFEVSPTRRFLECGKSRCLEVPMGDIVVHQRLFELHRMWIPP